MGSDPNLTCRWPHRWVEGLRAGWRRVPSWWGGVLGCLVVASFLLAVHWRGLTYVCGNDPMLYMRAARVLLSPAVYGADAVVQALTFVAPGYPLLLAACMGLFGALAAYWVNLLLLLGLLPLMWGVLRRLMGGVRPALLAMLFFWILILGGHELNAAYLLYPFREAAVLLCVYAAYALLLRAAAAGRKVAWSAAAAVAAIGACLFREPSIFIAVGLVLGIPLLTQDRRTRWRLVGGFLLPWAILALLALVGILTLGYAGSSQFEALRYLRGYVVVSQRMARMLPWILSEAGWWGTVAIIVGILRAARRAPVLLVWFLVPAVLLFVFYAFMQVHTRYFLAAFLFLAVFAGYGLDGLMGLVEGRVRRPGVRAGLSGVLTVAAVVVMLVGMNRVVRQVKPWGPQVTAAQVREWQAYLGALESGADGRLRIVLEQRCRYLEDLLLAYTDAEILDPKQMQAWPAGWAPAHYFQPLNREAEYATPQWLMHLKVYAHRMLADRVDLRPAGPGEAEPPLLGDGRYAYRRVTPWRAGLRVQELTGVEGGALLWFDWGRSGAELGKQVRVLRSDGVCLAEHRMIGQGLQALLLPDAGLQGGDLRIEIMAEEPIPAAPVVAVARPGEPFGIDLLAERPLSANRLFPERRPADVEPQGPSLTRRRELALVAPPLYAMRPVVWTVRLRGKVDSGSAALYLCGVGEGLTTFVTDASPLADGVNFASVPGQRWRLQLAGAQYPAGAQGLVLHEIAFAIAEGGGKEQVGE